MPIDRPAHHRRDFVKYRLVAATYRRIIHHLREAVRRYSLLPQGRRDHPASIAPPLLAIGVAGTQLGAITIRFSGSPSALRAIKRTPSAPATLAIS